MQTREKQPFFKPLSNISTEEMTNPSSLYESSVRQRTNQTTFHINRQKENEMVQEQTAGSEKLSSLHAKLHQEADRIRKWKVQTEIEIKQKDKKIQEATHTVESLRKSVLELQLQNESLSLKLQEEMGSREDILQRINATRDMCNLLKEHTARTEERLSRCEVERTELKYKEKEHLKQFEELSKKFAELEITARADRDKLQNMLNIERSEKEKIEIQLTECIEDAELKLKNLENQCEEKDLEIRDVRADLRKNEEKMHEVTCHLDDCKKRLHILQDDFHQKENLLSDSDNELHKSKNHCHALEDQIAEMTQSIKLLQKEKEDLEQQIKDSENDLNTQISCLTGELETSDQHLQEEKRRVETLSGQLDKANTSIEDLKSAKDMVVMEKSEIECQLNSVLEMKAQLENEQEEHLRTIKEINLSLEEHQKNINDQKELLESEKNISDVLRNQVEVLNIEKLKMQEEIIGLTQDIAIKDEQLQNLHSEISQHQSGATCLNDEVTKLSNLLCQEKEKLDELLVQKRNLGDELQCYQQELSEKEQELNSRHKEIEKSNKTIKKLEKNLEECGSNEDEMRKEIEELKAELETKISELESLKENREEQDKMLNGELEEKSKEANALDNKVKNLKETVSAKTKQIKELEKEVRAIKSKLTSQTKETDSREKQIEELNDELQSLVQEKQELENQNVELKNLADEEKKAADLARKEEKQLKKQSEKAVKEKEQAVQKCEHQIAELMATLEKYQQENAKIVAQKDKELEEMRNAIEQNESRNKMETNDLVDELNKKLEEMTKQKNDAAGDKASADKMVTKLEKKIKKYENDVSKMEIKIKSLQEIVDVINAKKMETVGIQVDVQPQQSRKTKETSPVRKMSDYTSKEAELKKSTPNIRVAPKTPQLNQKKMEIKTPSEVECTPVLFKTPTSKTPTSAIKTPQRSILKSAERNSSVKKRRVAFESDGSDSDNSSSSELMEVEIGEIDCRYKGGQKNLPLHVRPSPKVKTPETRICSDDEMEDLVKKSKLTLQRKPRGPPVSKTPKQESRVHLSSGNKENIRTESFDKITAAPRTPNVNIRKTPSKPPGKFFKSSPKDRPSHKAKKKEETWFDIDSVFGFED